MHIVMCVFSDTTLKLKEDKEIQEWGRDLAAPKENGGAGKIFCQLGKDKNVIYILTEK